MRKYIILTPTVCGMGGAELYTCRRAMHLYKKGFLVYVVTALHEGYFPLKDSFKNINIISFPELNHYSSILLYSRQRAIINKLKNFIGKANEYLIESHSLEMIEWGEILSYALHAKHLAYPLAEPKVSSYKFNPGKRIFLNKLRNNEFFGCTSTSLSIIFERSDVPANYVNIGFNETELSDRCIPPLNIFPQEGFYIISTVTRLDKTYIEPLVKSTAIMAEKYRKQHFILLIAGGCKDMERECYLHKNYSNSSFNLPNLDIIYTGYIEKLGKDFFSLSDVFVGMGTASINSISQRCLTINIDPRDGMQYSSGFFGIDTRNFAYPENGKKYEILSKLEEAYLMNNADREIAKTKGRSLFESEYDINVCFEKLDSIIESLSITNRFKAISVPSFYRLFVALEYKLYHCLFKKAK